MRLVAALLLLFACSVRADAGPSLIDALEQLRAAGLPVVYSARLVRPDYRVLNPPDPSLPLAEQAAELLAPFPLKLQRSEAGVWFVVRHWKADRPARNAPLHDTPMEEIVVTSRRRLVREWQAQHQLDGAQLETIPAIGDDLLRTVNQLPGLAHSGVSARNFPRGANSDESLYLLDGMEVIEPFHLSDYEALFSAVNTNLIGAVNVYQAGFPVRYGTRLASVIDMEVLPPAERFGGVVDINPLLLSAMTEGRLAANLSALASIRQSALHKLGGSFNDRYGEPRFHDEYARVVWEGDESVLQLAAMASNDELKLRDPSTAEAASSDYHNTIVWLSGAHTLAAEDSLRWRLSRNTIDNARTGSVDQPGDAAGTLDSQQEHNILSARLDYSTSRFDGWRLDAGIELQRQRAAFESSARARYGALAANIQPAAERRLDLRSRRDGDLSSFHISASRPIAEGVRLSLGVRYDNQDMDPVHQVQWSPRLRLDFEANERLRFYLDIGRYAQHQNLYELQIDDGLAQLNEPQLSDQLSIGMSWAATPALELRADAYRRRIDSPPPRFENLFNRWVLLPELHFDRVAVRPSEARAWGLDLSAAYRLDETLRIDASWSVARTEERIDGSWRPRPWDQRHAAKLALAWQPGNWRLALAAHYHQGWPTTAFTGGVLGSLRRDRLANYTSVDLHISRLWRFTYGELEAYADITNVADEENTGGYIYRMDGGDIRSEERNLLPLVPTIGVRWTW